MSQDNPESIMGYSPVGSRTDGFLIEANGAIEVLATLERLGHSQIGLRKVGLEIQCFLEFSNCGRQVTPAGGFEAAAVVLLSERGG